MRYLYTVVEQVTAPYMNHKSKNSMQRSLVLFENAIKTEATRKAYLYQLEKFRVWIKVKNYDELLAAPEKQIQVFLEDYLFYLKKKLSPNTIPSTIAPLELFYSMNDKILDFKKLRKMFPAGVKKSGYGVYSNQDTQNMLKHTSKKRSRAIVLFMASTGCRVGAIPDLKLRHVSDMPEGCKSVLFYEGSNEEHCGFLTPEATFALDEYLEERQKDGERLNSESSVFRAIYRLGMEKTKPMTTGTIKEVISVLVRSDISRNKIGNRYNIQIAHGFRKRFATIVKLNNKISYSVSERLLGHKAGEDSSYFRPTVKQELFGEFRKVISDLTVDDSERLRAQNRIKDETIQKMESENNARITKLENDLRQVYELLQQIQR